MTKKRHDGGSAGRSPIHEPGWPVPGLGQRATVHDPARPHPAGCRITSSLASGDRMAMRKSRRGPGIVTAADRITAVAADPANWGKQTAHYFNADDIDDDKNVRNS